MILSRNNAGYLTHPNRPERVQQKKRKNDTRGLYYAAEVNKVNSSLSPSDFVLSRG